MAEKKPMAALFFFFLLLCCSSSSSSSSIYLDALRSSLLFFEGQRSGRLPQSQRATWRSHSALRDGFEQGVDLVGGYYDAGDNVKFGLPMAFTITMLSWSVIEYGHHINAAGEMKHAVEAIKWGTDYLLKAHPEPNVLWGEVGDGDSDHYCWQRPEEMTTPRRAYRIDENNPGSDLAAETAAAMASASLVFRSYDRSYADLLVGHAKQLFAFANNHRGRYDSIITVARNYYQSESGYNDELLWASLWLYEATEEKDYLYYALENAHSLGGTGWKMTEFSWDVKYAGVQVLATKVFFQKRGRDTDIEALQLYMPQAEFFMCACLQMNYGGKNVARTPGGLMYTRSWNNMQYVSSATFLMTVYSDYLSTARQELHCGAGNVEAWELFSMAKSQADYVLGENPRGTSYMVGVGEFPQRIHHRAASIVSYRVNPSFVECREGYRTWYASSASDPNVHVGALVGGPDENDDYADDRDNFQQSEPATYNNAPFVGVLARLYGGGGSAHRRPSLPSPSAAAATTTQEAVSSDVGITQELASSWFYNGETFYRYKATLRNKTPRTLQQVQLSLARLHGPVWGLALLQSHRPPKSARFYTLPPWRTALAPGQSLDFFYVHAAPPATISIVAASFAP